MKIPCPYCHKLYEIPENDLGKTFTCSQCKQKFIAQIPMANSATRRGINISVQNNVDTSSSQSSSKGFPEDKDKLIYFILWFFLGFLGIHNFYIGRNTKGAIELVCIVIFFPITVILWITDIFILFES